MSSCCGLGGVLFLALVLGSPLVAQPSGGEDEPAESIDLSAYSQQLRDWARGFGELPDARAALRFAAAVPARYAVTEGEGRFEVNNEWLRAAALDLVTAGSDERDGLVERTQAKLHALAAEADSFTVAGVAGRESLESILARREFRRVQSPPGWKQMLWRVTERVFGAIARMLDKVPYGEQWGQVLVWMLIAVVACVLAIYLKRRAARADMVATVREPILFAPSSRSWMQWLAAARTAAQQKQWQEAIHLAYWAGIAYLEAGGSWAPDHTRTPREYLRLSGNNPWRAPLAELTRKFELVWYGKRPAGAADFEEALGYLGRIGCR